MDDSAIAALFDAATKVRNHAHAPYSGFAVGAALRAEDGRIYIGCNVENAAYPSGTCAEQGAIAAMIASGARQIESIAIVADAGQAVTPCGACRQRIREFASATTQIHTGNLSGARQTYRITDLLPDSFGPDHLPASQRG
jgi:cytidine deaminase